MYRVGVFFWILFGLVWLGGVISIATEIFRNSKESVAKNSTRGIVKKTDRLKDRLKRTLKSDVGSKLVDNYKTQQNASSSKLKIINNNLQYFFEIKNAWFQFVAMHHALQVVFHLFN